MEAPVMEYNMGSPSFLEVYAQMDRWGFAMFDIWELHRDRHGVMLQFDVLFVRMTSKLWSKDCTNFHTPAYFELDNPDRPSFHRGHHHPQKDDPHE